MVVHRIEKIITKRVKKHSFRDYCMFIKIIIQILNIMYKREIIRENGKIYEVIWQDAYGRRLNIYHIADYEEPKIEKKKNKKSLDE